MIFSLFYVVFEFTERILKPRTNVSALNYQNSYSITKLDIENFVPAIGKREAQFNHVLTLTHPWGQMNLTHVILALMPWKLGIMK